MQPGYLHMKIPNLFGVDGEPKLNGGGGDTLEATVSSKINSGSRI